MSFNILYVEELAIFEGTIRSTSVQLACHEAKGGAGFQRWLRPSGTSTRFGRLFMVNVETQLPSGND